MMKPVRITIEHDSKIADIVDRLESPIEYVRMVLDTMVGFGARWNNPDVLVFLSLQSDPTAPDYCIYEVMDTDTGQGVILDAYSGRTHKGLGFEKIERLYWSYEGSTCAEVQQLIAKLRG